MTSGYYPGWYLDAGYGPDDVEEPDASPPSCITVNVVKPELCDDGEYHDCRTFRSFPAFMAKAAWRWEDYWRRKYPKSSIWIEED
jgi:hypothetical protein